jgi:hypothetical protein
MVPPRHWACIDHRPIIQLYGANFAAGHDAGTLDYVYERFVADFAGIRPFIIAGPSWSFDADAKTGWGAALGGPIIGNGVAQVGPGYDDSPVPGRSTPTRDRLGGGFYAASWLLAMQAKPRMVIIETWNEMHEGTDICQTLEDGRYYIDLTRRFSDRFKQGQTPTGDEWAGAVRALLNTPASNRSGREFAGRLALELSVDPGGNLVEQGLRLCPGVADGAYQVAEMNGIRCIRTCPGVGDHRYLYFDIADPYYYDHRGTLTLTLTYLDDGRAPIWVQFDSARHTDGFADRYEQVPQPIRRTATGTWKTATVKLEPARCANRQNGGADFRLLSAGAELAIRHIKLTKLPDNYGD